jgi:hypothetical protein
MKSAQVHFAFVVQLVQHNLVHPFGKLADREWTVWQLEEHLLEQLRRFSLDARRRPRRLASILVWRRFIIW